MERDSDRISRAVTLEERFKRCLFCIPGRTVTIVEVDPLTHNKIGGPERYNFVDELTAGLPLEDITREITSKGPLGQALLGAKKGSVISYGIDGKEVWYKIIKIETP